MEEGEKGEENLRGLQLYRGKTLSTGPTRKEATAYWRRE